MAKSRRSRLLVIDASVARSAGESNNPISECCRNLLMNVYEICHKMVWTSDIGKEWKNHESIFTRKWRHFMNGRKKIVEKKPKKITEPNLKNLALNRNDQKEFEKDICLIEAACSGDSIIITLDDKFKRIWEKYKSNLMPFKQIKWINPKNDLPDYLQKKS